jgi:hypothetical protein
MFSSMIKVSDTEEPELEEFCLNLKMNILRDIKKPYHIYTIKLYNILQVSRYISVQSELNSLTLRVKIF